jgi:hypothetical protein
MRKLTLSLGLLPGILLVATLGAAPQAGNAPNRICVYEHSNFAGWEHCFNAGENIADLSNTRNQISSIRVFGNARATVFSNKNFEGSSLLISSDNRDLAQTKMGGLNLGSWNDVIESLQVGPAPPPPPAPAARVETRTSRTDDRTYRVEPYRDDRYSRENGICVFEEPNYRGRTTCFLTGEAIGDLARSGNWNDRISSIRFQGPTRAILYYDANFRGDRVTLDRDIPDLRQLRIGSRTWDNQISSLEINGGRGNAYGRDNSRRFR